MADPLSISASITALLQLTSTVVKYLNGVKDASEDRNKILVEISSASGLLYSLKDLSERAGSGEIWLHMVKSLNVSNGPLEQFKSALEHLAAKLAPAIGLKKARIVLLWPFRKGEIKDILCTIERQKTIFGLALQKDHLALSNAMRVDVTDIQLGVKELQIAQRNDGREKVLQWLSSADVSANHNAACSKHEPMTGDWFLRSKDFVTWKSDADSFLWLYGIPGCGKTILCSTIIRDVKQFCNTDRTNVLAYFYFDFNEPEKQIVANLLRSIIAQLSTKGEFLPNAVQILYSQYEKDRQQPNMQALISILSSVMESYGNIYIILDALDECSEKDELLSVLTDIAGRKIENLHILATSRKEREIEVALDNIVTGKINIRNAEVDADIGLLVRNCLVGDPKLKRWPNQVKDEIEASLLEGAKGMFRWVVCQLDALKKCMKVSVLRQALKQLPRTLDDTYDRILKSLPEDYTKEAYAALQWLAFSQRPLYLEEVAEAAILEPGKCSLDSEERLSSPHDILEICSSLITNVTTMKGETQCEELRFAHFSVKEYILSDRIQKGPASAFAISSTAAHTFISEVCLSHLLLFDRPASLSKQELEKFPLLRYAAEFWPVHVKYVESKAALTTTTTTLAFAILNSSRGASFLNWLRIFDVDKPWERNYGERGILDKQLKNVPSPLYYASYLGLFEMTRLLVETGLDINAQGGNHGSALHAAAHGGHEAVVRLLLESGLDVNAQYKYCGTALEQAASGGHEAVARLLLKSGSEVNVNGGGALQAAARGGHEAVVRLLLESGSAANTQGGQYSSALLAAVMSGNEAVVWLLLKNGSDINTEGINGNELHLAALGGHEAIVRLLLESGSDINKQGVHGNALQIAASRGHEAVVRLLLKSGSDINVQDENRGTVLEQAASGGHEAVVRLLLKNGSEVNVNGGGALQAAARGSHKAVVQLLIESGSDINAQGGFCYNMPWRFWKESELDVNAQGGPCGNALQAAAHGANEAVVQLLLESGSDVNVQGGHCGNALQAAADKGNEAVVRLLLKSGSDVNVQGGHFGNALQAAAHGGHEAIVRLLLERGSDVNKQGGHYGSALQAAANLGFNGSKEAVVRLLLERGADVNAQGGYYGNALQAAAHGWYEAVVRLLLESGSVINMQGGQFGNALQAAAHEGDQAVVRLLIENGSVINAQGGHFGNALLAAAHGGNEAVVRLLLEKGAEISGQSKYGETALHRAAKKGHNALVELLLEKGANIAARDRSGQTALHGAASAMLNSEVTVWVLLDKGADINALDNSGRTALHNAASTAYHSETVSLLLDEGADIIAQDINGCTALHDAAKIGDEAIVRALLEKGGDPDIQNKKGQTPLLKAQSLGHEAVVQLFKDHRQARQRLGSPHDPFGPFSPLWEELD